MKLKTIFVLGNSCTKTVCNLLHRVKGFYSLGKGGVSVSHDVVFGKEISILLLDILH